MRPLLYSPLIRGGVYDLSIGDVLAWEVLNSVWSFMIVLYPQITSTPSGHIISRACNGLYWYNYGIATYALSSVTERGHVIMCQYGTGKIVRLAGGTCIIRHSRSIEVDPTLLDTITPLQGFTEHILAKRSQPQLAKGKDEATS